MEGDIPYKSFVQTETFTNEVHFAAYQKAFFFANSYPLWMRHCGLHSDRDGQHFKGANTVNFYISAKDEPTFCSKQKKKTFGTEIH